MENMVDKVYSKGQFEVKGAKDELKLEITTFKYGVNPNLMGLGYTARDAVET